MTSMNRRNFLKGALAAGALTAASASMIGCAPQTSSSEEPAAAAQASTEGGLTAETATQKWSFEIPPDPIAEENIAETVEADLVVVGAGTSGLVTATSAAESGLNVIVVSASEKPVSRGGSNNAVYCKAMEREGFERISPYVFQKEIHYMGNQVDERKWYKHYNNSETAMNWVIDMMESAGYKVKVEHGTPGEPTDLYYETCSIGWDLGEGMEMPDPEMEVATGMMQPLLVSELARHLTEDLGGRIDFKTKAEQLIREDDNTGRVTAVVCSREDGSYAKYAGTKAIVLATGDFSANRDMMYKYAPRYAPYITDDVYDGETNYDVGFQYGGLFKGDGQRMGLWIGAAWQKVQPNCVMGGFFGPGPRNLYSNFLGLLVNRNGERFMNEDCISPCAGMNNYGQPGRTVFALWDSQYPRYEVVSGSWNNDSRHEGDEDEIYQAVIDSWESDVENGAMVKADTIEGVIEALGLPAETIETVNRYNEIVKSGKDTDFYKASEHLHPIDQGPFYGQASNGENPVFLTVLGGLNTDAYMRVCDAEDKPIPGLYNVGTMVGDMWATNYTFMVEGGNYGANCITFGYLTGKYIAENE